MSTYCHRDREYLYLNLSCSVFKLHAQCRIDLSQPNISSLFPSSQGSFSIEIRCSEYIPLTRCCQHWFPFLSEIWCWNPLQADKYLYTWLPDLIAFCKSGLYWSHSQCMPHYIVFLFCYPILCPSQSPHLNKNISSMLGCSREAWWSIGGVGRGREGSCLLTVTEHVTLPNWRCRLREPLFMYCVLTVGCLF